MPRIKKKKNCVCAHFFSGVWGQGLVFIIPKREVIQTVFPPLAQFSPHVDSRGTEHQQGDMAELRPCRELLSFFPSRGDETGLGILVTQTACSRAMRLLASWLSVQLSFAHLTIFSALALTAASLCLPVYWP